MAKTWLTADWHLGETRLELMGRPFASTREMNETLLNNFWRIISPDDHLVVVGDVISKSAENPKSYLEWIAEFPGKKTLIRGNHDEQFSDADFSPYFSSIIAHGEGISVEYGGIPCMINHYPTLGVQSHFNLVGHIHAAWKYQLNSFNVGVDANHYLPVDSEKIPFHFKAICDFYDDDVWVAYNPANSSFSGTRGKKGSYYVKP